MQIFASITKWLYEENMDINNEESSIEEWEESNRVMQELVNKYTVGIL